MSWRRREASSINNGNTESMNKINVSLGNVNREDTETKNIKSNMKHKSELDAINAQNSFEISHTAIPKTGEDNNDSVDGEDSIDEKPSKKVSALISQFNSIVHSSVPSHPKSSSFRAASKVAKLGPSGNEINVTRSQSLTCKMSVASSVEKSDDIARGKKTTLQTTSEEPQLATLGLSAVNGIKGSMKNSRVAPIDIKIPTSLVNAVIQTSENDNRVSVQSTNDKLLTESLATVGQKSNTLPNKLSWVNKTTNSEARSNVKVGSVWSTASIFDTIAKSEEKSKLNIQNQNDRPAVKPRTNTAWSKLRSSLGHNFSASSFSSLAGGLQNKDIVEDLAASTQISKNNADLQGVAGSIETFGDRVQTVKNIDKKSKMESNMNIRGSISPPVGINPEIPRYRKTSLKSIAQITDSMVQDFYKAQELSSPPPSSGNKLQVNVSAAKVCSDLTTVKKSSGFTQFKDHVPTAVELVTTVVTVEDSKNVSSSKPDEGIDTKSGPPDVNAPVSNGQGNQTSGNVGQRHEKDEKPDTMIVKSGSNVESAHENPKQQTPKRTNSRDIFKEPQVQRQSSRGAKTETVSKGMIFDVLDVQNTKVAYCNATERINNALNKLKTELMSMRQMDLLLLKQLINISQTIQKIQKSRVLRVSKSLSFSSSYLHPKPLQSQKRFHSSTLERQNSAPFTMDRKRLMFRDMRSSTESSLSSFDESEFDSQSEMDESTTSLPSIYPYLSPKAIRARAMSQSRVSELSLSRDLSEDPDKTYEDILKRNVRLWKLGVARQTSVIEEVTCLL